MFRTGTVFDACWHHVLRVDPAEQEKTRRMQVLELSRYGRLGGLHEWDDEPVRELRAWHAALRELLGGEPVLVAHGEDR
jgi:hypothetical protein